MVGTGDVAQCRPHLDYRLCGLQGAWPAEVCPGMLDSSRGSREDRAQQEAMRQECSGESLAESLHPPSNRQLNSALI